MHPIRRYTVSALLIICLVSTIPLAAAQEAAPTRDVASAAYAPGQVLIGFKTGLSAAQGERILAEQGVTSLSVIPRLGVHLVRLAPSLDVDKEAARFRKLPGVAFAEPNYIVHIADISDPGLDKNQWGPQRISAPAAWQTTEGNPAIIIAVVDTGVDYGHGELAPNIWSNAGEIAGNGVDDDGNSLVDDIFGWDYANRDADPMDDHFHGTHVAGIAAAAPTGDPAGIVGVCPRCRIMAVKALDASGSGTMDAVASAVIYAADNGARVINLSLGATAASQTLEQAVNYAWGKGAVVAAAAGNNGNSSVLYPAAYANAVSVAATNSDDLRSCFSNYGNGTVSVAAPGELIYSTTPRDAGGGDAYGTYSGTSMATPHVAGLAGLLFAQNPTRSNAAVRSLIESTTVDLGPAGRDAYFGHGRINAQRAVSGDTSATTSPASFFSEPLATAYANARKLVRDDAGLLHLVWHDKTASQYQVLHAFSTDGAAWSAAQPVFASESETYNPALATDGSALFTVFPSKDSLGSYRILFSRAAAAGDGWAAPIQVMDDAQNPVRPSLYYDAGAAVLHVVASSLDSTPHFYYASSANGGQSWSAAQQINAATGDGQRTRYAAVYADGDKVVIAGRTIQSTFFGLFNTFRTVVIASADGGVSWSAPQELSNASGADYGVSLAGSGGALHLAYEQASNVYARSSSDGLTWSSAQKLGAGAWPSITASGDEAWTLWEKDGGLFLRRYTGSFWDSVETVSVGSTLAKSFYANLKEGASAGAIEWAATQCPGAPYNLSYGQRALADMPIIPRVQLSAAEYNVSESASVALLNATLSAATTRPVTVTYATADGTALAYKDYNPVKTALVFAAGETSKAISITLRADASDEPAESFTVSLSAPVNANLGDPASAAVVIADDDPPPAVAFASGYVSVQENAGKATLSVRLSAASAFPVSVAYTTASGVAVAGEDFVATSGLLSFEPGATTKSFTVDIVDDEASEGSESFAVALSTAANATIGALGNATVNIYASDSLSFAAGGAYLHESTAAVSLTVRLSGPASQPVSVSYATASGTASAGSDFSPSSGSLTFEPGATSKTIAVPIIDDALGEPNEAFTVHLSNAAGATLIAPSVCTVTLYANDSLYFFLSGYTVQETAGVATITVKLNAPSNQAVSVDYATVNGTAMAGADYLAASGTLTFEPGQTSQSFLVSVLDDADGEGSESFTIRLSSPVNASVGSPSVTAVTIPANDSVQFSTSYFYAHEHTPLATVTVKLNSASTLPITVDYATTSGTAVAGSDYIAANGTLLFAPGETSKTFTVTIIDDDLRESSETIRLTLSNPVNAGLGSPATATMTIFPND